MDLRWPILAGGLALGGGAAAAAWWLGKDPFLAGGVAVGTLGIAAALSETVARRQDVAMLRREIRKLGAQQSGMESDMAIARDGMLAVREALSEGGGAVRARMQVMADEMAILQKLVARLQDVVVTADGGDAPAPVERRTAGIMTDAEVLALVRQAVSDGAVDLYMQPVVTLPQRRKRYFECFSRIPDHRGGVLAADTYVAAAENAGLIAAIDNLLLFRAVQLVRRARSRNAHVGFFCNVSRHTLKDVTFLSDLVSFLEDNLELAPSLILEIAQPDWDPEDRTLTRYMSSLSGLGVRFSLDRVRDFTLDATDLGKRGFHFVKAEAAALLSEDGPDAEILQRILARHDIRLVVEKIETERDLVELLEHGVDLGQGYLFGAPKAPAPVQAAA